MTIGALVGLVTTFGPALTSGAKKVFGLKKKELEGNALRETRVMVHKALPLLIGLAAGIAAHLQAGLDLQQAVLAGIAGGAGGSYMRDLDKNKIGLVKFLIGLLGKK